MKRLCSVDINLEKALWQTGTCIPNQELAFPTVDNQVTEPQLNMVNLWLSPTSSFYFSKRKKIKHNFITYENAVFHILDHKPLQKSYNSSSSTPQYLVSIFHWSHKWSSPNPIKYQPDIPQALSNICRGSATLYSGGSFEPPDFKKKKIYIYIYIIFFC